MSIRAEHLEGKAVIRIRLGAMPALLSEIVGAALEGEEDFYVTHSQPPGDGAAGPIEAGDCDVLLVCPDAGRDPGVALSTLAADLPPAIIAISPDGETATLLRINRSLRRISAIGDLREVIRLASRMPQTAGRC